MESFVNGEQSTFNISDFERTDLYDASALPSSEGHDLLKVAGKSIKEIEDELNGLRKENFNLKLRIFFLEENISPGFNIEETVKANVNLRMEAASLKNDLDQSRKALQIQKEEHKMYKKEMEKSLADLNEKLKNQELFNKKIEEYKSTIAKQTAELDKFKSGFMEKDDKITKLEELLRTTTLSNDLMEASASSVSMRRSPLKPLSPGNVTDFQKIAKLEKEQLKACQVIKKLAEGRKKDQAEMEELSRKLKVKDAEIENLKKVKEQGNKSTNIKQNIDNSINEDHKELLDQYKELTEELDSQKQILMDTLKEKEAQISTLEEKHSMAIDELKYQNERMHELELELFGKENREKSDSGTEKDEKSREIERLKKELSKKTSDLQTIINKELWEKNQEIEKLQNKITMYVEEIDYLKEVSDEYVNYKRKKDEEVKELEIVKNEFLKSKKETERNSDVNKSELAKNNADLNQYTEDRKKLLSRIEELKTKLKESDENLSKSESLRSEVNDICFALSTRLEELARFLEWLLRQKSILGFLGGNRNGRLKQIVNQSLDLSRSLNMSLSMNLDQSSLMQLTNISELLEMTRIDSFCAEQLMDDEDVSLSPERLSLGYRNCMDEKNSEKIIEQAETIKNLKEQLETMQHELELRKVEETEKLLETGSGESDAKSISQLEHKNECDFEPSQSRNNETQTPIEEANEALLKRITDLEEKLSETEKKRKIIEEEKITSNSKMENLYEQIEQLNELVEELDNNKKMLSDTVEENLKIIHSLECELSETLEGKEIIEEELMLAQERLRSIEGKNEEITEELEQKLNTIKVLNEKIESLEEEIINLKIQFHQSETDYLETITGLRKDLDEAVMHYSELVFEKNRIENENNKLESDLIVRCEKENALTEEINNLKDEMLNFQRESEKPDSKSSLCTRCENEEMKNSNIEENSLLSDCINRSVNFERRAGSSLDRRSANSTDLRVGSDHGKSQLEEENLNSSEGEVNCCGKNEEINRLKRKLEKSERLLREALKKLARANERKREIEKNICSQISKTSQVLKRVKANLDPKSEEKPED